MAFSGAPEEQARVTTARWQAPAVGGAISHRHGHAHDHAVQFYEDEAFLATVVCEFLAGGLRAGQPVLVIATASHKKAFLAGLRAQGVDVGQARRSGQLTLLDARRTLNKLMNGDTPDVRRFRTVVGGVIETSLVGREHAAVCAYGEMVDLLWKDGNAAGAIRLEDLWNQLAKSYNFSLLCAYNIGNFARAADAEQFGIICAQHTHVVPTERYVQNDDAARLVEISLLQQRARALEAEIEHREALEQRLRETVTALQDREEALRDVLERERIARADAERANAEAQRARTLAEHANRAKGEFLAVMSHELRTPLNAIGGYAELMELGIHGPVTPQQRESLERVQRSQRLLLGLVNQVLNYARVETGNVRYDLADVPLDEVLRAVDGLVAPQIRLKGLRYSYGGCEGDVSVRVDGEKLQQIVLNLLTNAVKFTDSGGVVRLEVECVESLVRLHVSDTGIGIPAEKMDVIFDPFVQVDANYTRTRDGVGLGLAISRDLARGMGGDLSVTSTHGEGSTFTLTIPRGGSPA
jgi:signal transduction histidine kinase